MLSEWGRFALSKSPTPQQTKILPFAKRMAS
jgi:hypothetical protein